MWTATWCGSVWTRSAGAAARFPRSVAEVGKDHGYLRRLNSYWRFAETPKGVFVEAETITLSDEFGSMTRMLGSALMGINPGEIAEALARLRCARAS